jgi:hypothetical protein
MHVAFASDQGYAIRTVVLNVPYLCDYFLYQLYSADRPSSSESSTPIDIKHSSDKSLTLFLKACEKDGLISLKPMKKHVVITAAEVDHPEVLSHYATTR